MNLRCNGIHGFHRTIAAGHDLFHAFPRLFAVVLYFFRILLQLSGTDTDVIDRLSDLIHTVTDILHIFRHFLRCGRQLLHRLTDLSSLFCGGIASLCHLPYTV